MKKTVTILLLVVLLVSVASVFMACSNDDATFKNYEKIADKNYKVGDEFNVTDAGIVAVFNDGSKKNVTKNLVVDGLDELKLDDKSLFTDESVGTHKVTVYALEIREDYKIGEWTIIVSK